MENSSGSISSSMEKANFLGWQAVILRNNLVKVMATPDIGGRLMAYDLDGYPLLYVDQQLAGKIFTASENQGDGSLAAWKNYGGDKTWPSPQGWDSDEQWHGPPDPVLDTGRYHLTQAVSEQGKAVVTMVSPPDHRTGVQITRQATLYPNSTRLVLHLTFTNIIDRPIRWSIWDVVQLRADRIAPDNQVTFDLDCLVTAPLNPNSRFAQGFNIMFGAPNNPQWMTDPSKGLFIARYLWEIGKVGIDSPAGWIAFSNTTAGIAFIERFTHYPDQEYPDQGASVECWTVGKGKVANLDYELSGIYLMETEVLSPLYRIEPGEHVSFDIAWNACRIDGMVIDVQDAGCTAEPFQVDHSESSAHARGDFGVFEPGNLLLVWRTLQGQPLEQHNLGAVSPLAAVHLDRSLVPPLGAKFAELVLRANGQDSHLAETTLE
jgi:hypothetical protein